MNVFCTLYGQSWDPIAASQFLNKIVSFDIYTNPLSEESLFGPNIEQKILSQEHNERFFYLKNDRFFFAQNTKPMSFSLDWNGHSRVHSVVRVTTATTAGSSNCTLAPYLLFTFTGTAPISPPTSNLLSLTFTLEYTHFIFNKFPI